MMFKALLTVCSLAAAVLAAAAPIAVKSGEKIAFLGDSITQQGNQRPAGYIHLVIDGLRRSGVKASAIPAGISGHKSNDMLKRLQTSVLDKKPDWMLLSCGVNDVWHQDRKKGVSLEDYRRNITEIVDRAQRNGIKVMILSATMIQENPEEPRNRKLEPYNDFLRSFAAERKLPLADLNALMQKQVAAETALPAGRRLTVDGVHMNAIGNMMMAEGILAAFGVPQQKIAECRAAWSKMPNTIQINRRGAMLSVDDYRKVIAKAAARGEDPEKMLHDALMKVIDEL